MAESGAELEGADQLVATLRRLAKRIPDAVARAMYEEYQIEATEVRKRTPVDTGALRSTIAVHPPIVAGRDITVEMTCGGPSAPYALFVHEDVEAFHAVGQAKFMESVILESVSFMPTRIARRVDVERLI